MLRLVLRAWLAVACAGLTMACGDPTPPPRDRAAYLRAMEASPEAAGRLCMGIVDAALRGQCVVHAAQDAAYRADLGLASRLCALKVEPVWRAECAFLVADTAQLEGVDGMLWCAAAGPFASACTEHVALRGLIHQALDGPHTEAGQEVALRTRLHGLAERFPEPGQEGLQEKMVRTAMGAIIERRWRKGTIDPELCGKAEREECLRAFDLTLEEAVRVHGIDVCHERPLEALSPHLSWTPEAVPMLRLAIKLQCGSLGRSVW